MKEQLEQLALRAALGGILSDVPADLGEGSEFMQWYEDVTGQVNMPEDMSIWAPFENETDDTLREHIDMEVGNMMLHFKGVLELMVEPVHELGMAIENGDPQAIADRWLSIKPKVDELLGQQAVDEDEYSSPRP